jgi:hypothetical protein
MKVIKDNNVRTLLSFEFKHKTRMTHSDIIDIVKMKNQDFKYESSNQTEHKIFVIIKGKSCSNAFLEVIKNIDNIKEIQKKELKNTSFFFDIKINNKRLISKLEGECNECTIIGILNYFLKEFKFFETLSNFIYFDKHKCLRLYFKDIIDYEYASLEFSKYTKRNEEKNFVYPKSKNTKDDNIDTLDNNFIENNDEGLEIKKFMGKKVTIRTNKITTKKDSVYTKKITTKKDSVYTEKITTKKIQPKKKKVKKRKRQIKNKKRKKIKFTMFDSNGYDKLNSKIMRRIDDEKIKEFFSTRERVNDTLFTNRLESVLVSLERD